MLQTIIVTGGTRGLGLGCVRALLERQRFRVVATSHSERGRRNLERSLSGFISGGALTVLALDLGSLASVRAFVEQFRSLSGPPLGGIVCNAGISPVSNREKTADGFELAFGVNHLGHFLLVNLLLRDLATPARILVISSGLHDPARYEKGRGVAPRYESARLLAYPSQFSDAGGIAYNTSKLCNVLFTYELARRLERSELSTPEAPICVNAFNPGLMPRTGLARFNSISMKIAWNLILPMMKPMIPAMRTPKKSGEALAMLATDDGFAGITGKYFEDTEAVRSSEDSYDLAKARDLWETSVELARLSPDESPLATRV